MNLRSTFYTNLYKKKETKESNYNFFNNSINQINEEQIYSCEGNLTEYECRLSLKNMKNNKNPGSDRINH